MKRLVFLFLIVSSITFTNNVNTLQNKVKKIDTEIKQKNTRIKKIDTERTTLENQIKQIEDEMKEIQNNSLEIQEEIKTVNKNINYGELNLKSSNSILDTKKMDYKAKMIAISRKNIDLISNKEKSIAKRSYSRLLYGDLENMEKIKEVQNSIKVVKGIIEKDKLKLVGLRKQLDDNRRKILAKNAEHKNLIVKLGKEKSTHVKTIAKLQTEKKSIEKEIEKIIKARSTQKKDIKLNSALLALGKFEKPLNGKVVVKYGQKKNGVVTSNGIEIAGNMGDKIKTSLGGKVIYADKFQGLGNVVMIDYGYNTIGVYGNLISVGVKLNQQVKKGQDIGILGLTTDSKSNLYYEVRFNLKTINPEGLF